MGRRQDEKKREDARALYVALSRAKKRLYITSHTISETPVVQCPGWIQLMYVCAHFIDFIIRKMLIFSK